uniref:CSON014705 protein n=1 Tax=Culicoides sonorensis TaxID=179676 RepID=A0A336MH40_CULSO
MPGKVDKASATSHEGDITALDYCSKTGLLYTAGGDGKVKVWDKDLNLKNELIAHESWIYCIAVSPEGKVYTGSNDGTIRVLEKPLEQCESKQICKTLDEIESLYIQGDTVYSGDDKGVVAFFEDDKFKSRIETSEEVKNLIVENGFIYTIRDRDLSIFAADTSKTVAGLQHRAAIPGCAPICLFGDIVNGKRAYLGMLTRGAKGLKVIKNHPDERFAVLCEKDDLHELIINALTGIDNFLFTGDYVGKVKKWSVDGGKLNLVGEIEACPGVCINCLKATDSKTVYCGSSDGILRKLDFS